MRTGLVDNWLNVDTFGPIYPFVGTEVLLSVLGIAFWIIWHFIQIRKENAEFAEDIKQIKDKGGIINVLKEEADREMGDSIR